ncbi:uncharacterized protein BDW70DRAFT_105125 [Aspergillus foveolatus]|uniref:uncharacterized protein n=1 Tax=Aspergillus foveolatus TaxID=210207 RepID=UPI003CCD4473
MTRIRRRRRSLQPLAGTLTLIILLAHVPAVSAANPSSSTSSSSSSSSLRATQSDTQAHPSRGSKAGIFIGATVGVLAIAAAITLFFCSRRRRRRRRRRLSCSPPALIPAPTSAVEIETNKAVTLDAVLETTGSDPDGHNQNRAEANSQSQQPETEVMGHIKGPQY